MTYPHSLVNLSPWFHGRLQCKCQLRRTGNAGTASGVSSATRRKATRLGVGARRRAPKRTTLLVFVASSVQRDDLRGRVRCEVRS